MSTILKRMDTESIIRHFILAAMILLIVGLIFLVICWPQNHSKTFSQHAAAHNTSTVYYILLFTAVIPLLSVFFFGWFIRSSYRYLTCRPVPMYTCSRKGQRDTNTQNTSRHLCSCIIASLRYDCS